MSKSTRSTFVHTIISAVFVEDAREEESGFRGPPEEYQGNGVVIGVRSNAPGLRAFAAPNACIYDDGSVEVSLKVWRAFKASQTASQ